MTFFFLGVFIRFNYFSADFGRFLEDLDKSRNQDGDQDGCHSEMITPRS